ncbi:unnamed protein product [Meloidogyne enterolobii]|uniref:Uncharacterized protein n=1 Tax=Meloidogyne enterolobii TaxID=390850 RepID=A0ACB0ZDZ2_MELEN
MLAYVYGVVPLSLCRNGACGGGGGGGTSQNEDNVGGNSTFRDEEEKIVLTSEGNKNVNNNNRENSSTTKTTSKSSFHQRRQSIASFGLVSLTDKPNTEDASIQAIAGSQYNYDNRSVHTIWSSGCHVGVIESVHGVNINGEDAENASTMACCSASIAAQASERRSLTGSNSSFKTRPRSSISNSRGVSEEPGKIPAKFTRKVSVKHVEGINGVREIGGGGSSVDERIRQEIFLPPSSSSQPGGGGGSANITFSNNNDLEQKKKSRFSLRFEFFKFF